LGPPCPRPFDEGGSGGSFPGRASSGLSPSVERVELVENQHLRHPVSTDLSQHALHFVHLLQMETRVGGVDHVQQQVGVGRLLQRGLEGLDQPCGRSRMKPTVSDSETERPASPR
jgi:hypothetical protein